MPWTDPNIIVGATVSLMFIVGVLKRYGIINVPVNRKEKADMEKYLTKEKHTDLCRINSLEIEKIVSKEVAELKSQMWPALRLMYRKINGNKDDTEMDEILK